MNSFHNDSIADPSDIDNNKFMAVLSYLGILVLIPLIAAKQSPYARFHATQGVNVLLVYISSSVITYIPFLPFDGLLSTALYVFAFILSIIGIINALKGEMKPLPLIGHLRVL